MSPHLPDPPEQQRLRARADRVLRELLAHPEAERQAGLDAACAGDDELRQLVRSLLAAAGTNRPTS